MNTDIYNAISHVQRRRKLLALLEHNPQDESPVYFDNPPNSRIEQHRQRQQMVNVHLPLLEKLGFIDWDIDQYEVTKGSRFNELRPLLDRLDDQAERSTE